MKINYNNENIQILKKSQFKKWKSIDKVKFVNIRYNEKYHTIHKKKTVQLIKRFKYIWVVLENMARPR